MKFSEKIKKLRLQKNYTQEDLAVRLHVSRQTISKWEKEITVPSLDTLKELAIIFDVELIYLIEDSEAKPKIYKYKNRTKTLYFINVFVVIFTILSGLILYRGMDGTIPAHYDFFFNITRYGNKIEYLVIPGISLIFFMFSVYFYFVLSKKEEYKKSVIFNQVWMLSLQVIILFFTVWLGFRYTSNIEDKIVIITTGLTLALIFDLVLFSHPKFNHKKNIIFGFRTNFTLNNDEAWYKVNSLSSISGSVFIFIAYLITLITYKEWNLYLFSFIVIAILPALIYHEVLKRKSKNNK